MCLRKLQLTFTTNYTINYTKAAANSEKSLFSIDKPNLITPKYNNLLRIADSVTINEQ